MHMAADEPVGALRPMLAKNFDQDHPDLFVARAPARSGLPGSAVTVEDMRRA
ncbi:hypothetical protein [Streptomyces sp. NBC_01314]|uniref:hypothetical protein n=1 Tax=Streptomyces sp. NBC_01314 TaxID=2903821 RepID=UPI0030899670|nr:hypothetical protein OG622_49095 [Streptomyces sp. NBC_01314]